jgi:hypothetical protein
MIHVHYHMDSDDDAAIQVTGFSDSNDNGSQAPCIHLGPLWIYATPDQLESLAEALDDYLLFDEPTLPIPAEAACGPARCSAPSVDEYLTSLAHLDAATYRASPGAAVAAELAEFCPEEAS